MERKRDDSNCKNRRRLLQCRFSSTGPTLAQLGMTSLSKEALNLINFYPAAGVSDAVMEMGRIVSDTKKLLVENRTETEATTDFPVTNEERINFLTSQENARRRQDGISELKEDVTDADYQAFVFAAAGWLKKATMTQERLTMNYEKFTI
jgi:hypothetical protein